MRVMRQTEAGSTGQTNLDWSNKKQKTLHGRPAWGNYGGPGIISNGKILHKNLVGQLYKLQGKIGHFKLVKNSLIICMCVLHFTMNTGPGVSWYNLHNTCRSRNYRSAFKDDVWSFSTAIVVKTSAWVFRNSSGEEKCSVLVWSTSDSPLYCCFIYISSPPPSIAPHPLKVTLRPSGWPSAFRHLPFITCTSINVSRFVLSPFAAFKALYPFTVTTLTVTMATAATKINTHWLTSIWVKFTNLWISVQTTSE